MSHQRQQAEQAVLGALRDVFEDDELEVRPTDNLQQDLGMESMTFLHLAIQLENFLDAPLGEDPEQLPETVRELVDLVSERMEIRAHVA